jgi:ubiquinone/menaquinone biosynthesis C-methylase UbiE
LGLVVRRATQRNYTLKTAPTKTKNVKIILMYQKQKKYFEIAYKTGSDIWTHKKYKSKVLEFISLVPSGGFVLDLGSGRGLWPFALVELGFKVIGIDYVDRLVEVNNQEVKWRGLGDKMRFVTGDVFDINFADETFDLVTDFGLVQHFNNQDFERYKNEVNRVLKPEGYVLNVSISKHTKQFLNFSPANSESGEFQVDGVHYYFFTDEEVVSLYGEGMEVVKQDHVVIPENNNEILVITLLRKTKGRSSY